jgi:hypothetical protein
MGCVHTYQGIPAIEGWNNLSSIWNIVKNIREANWKLGNISWIISQVAALGPKHDKIQAQRALDIPSEGMLEKIWCCRCSEMESWSRNDELFKQKKTCAS